MQLLFGVQVVEALENLAQDDGDVHLLEMAGLHEVERRAAAKVLHDDPQFGALQIGAVVLGDVGRVALRENHDLLLNVLDLVLGLLQVDDLDGDHLLAAIVDALEHLAERAFAYSLLLGEDLLRIGFLAWRAGKGERGC